MTSPTLSAVDLFLAASELADHKHEEGVSTSGGFEGFEAEDLVFGRVLAADALAGALDMALKGTMQINPHHWQVMSEAQSARAFLDKAEHAETHQSPIQAREYRAAANRKLIEAASWLF